MGRHNSSFSFTLRPIRRWSHSDLSRPKLSEEPWLSSGEPVNANETTDAQKLAGCITDSHIAHLTKVTVTGEIRSRSTPDVKFEKVASFPVPKASRVISGEEMNKSTYTLETEVEQSSSYAALDWRRFKPKPEEILANIPIFHRA